MLESIFNFLFCTTVIIFLVLGALCILIRFFDMVKDDIEDIKYFIQREKIKKARKNRKKG